MIAGRWYVLAWLIYLLVGCQPSAVPPTTQISPIGEFKVAILLPRPIDADSWTRAGYQGLLLIESELGADIAYTEDIPESDFEAVFRQYANDGYDFIIGHGVQFVPAAEIVAAEFPRIAFAISGRYAGNNINLGAVSPRETEMAYLFGAIAAMASQTGHIGYVGGADNISQREITAVYQRGAEATNPNIQVTIDLIGNFTDAERAEALAQAQIDAGVDVIFVLAGGAGTGIYAQAQAAGVFTLAWIEDLHELAPQSVLTSNVQNVPLMLLQSATLVEQGRWEGKQYKFGMAEGVQYLAPFYGLITREQETIINAIRNDILTGQINTLP